MEVIRNTGNIAEKRVSERINADNAKLKANLDYVAMMADIEIPTEEEPEELNEQVR